jgi:hypothetical protein
MSALMLPHALKSARIAVSVSESEDLPRLGLGEIHFRLALGEIARSIVVADGHVGYGGHLKATGYTAFLVQEVQRYGRRDQPLRVYLPWPEHRRMPLQELIAEMREIGLFGEILCLDRDGKIIDPRKDRSEAPEDTPLDIVRASLTAMRKHVSRDCAARVLIGGRRRGFQGDMPGLVEEALISLEERRPLYLVGGFGGATLDMIARVSTAEVSHPPALDSLKEEPRMTEALARFQKAISDRSWEALDNGLSPEENLLLANTPRPSEIAALISLGLGRRLKMV